MKDFFTAKRLAKLGIFSALSYILYLINIPLAFAFPSFLEINLADFPALIGGFMLGPISGTIIVAIRILLKLPFSSTACVGELGDFLMGIAFVLPPSIMYKYNKTKSTAMWGLLLGSICEIIIAMVLNRFLLVPFYLKAFFGGDINVLASTCKALFPEINGENFFNYYLWLSVLPFNILRCLIASLLTALTYKRLSILFNKLGNDKNI